MKTKIREVIKNHYSNVDSIKSIMLGRHTPIKAVDDLMILTKKLPSTFTTKDKWRDFIRSLGKEKPSNPRENVKVPEKA